MVLIVESKYGIIQVNDFGTTINYEDIGKACHLCSLEPSRVFALWDDAMLTKLGTYPDTMQGVYSLTCKISELQ